MKPGTQRPATVKPGTQRPATVKPGTQRPATVKPGTQRPATPAGRTFVGLKDATGKDITAGQTYGCKNRVGLTTTLTVDANLVNLATKKVGGKDAKGKDQKDFIASKCTPAGPASSVLDKAGQSIKLNNQYRCTNRAGIPTILFVRSIDPVKKTVDGEDTKGKAQRDFVAAKCTFTGQTSTPSNLADAGVLIKIEKNDLNAAIPILERTTGKKVMGVFEWSTINKRVGTKLRGGAAGYTTTYKVIFFNSSIDRVSLQNQLKVLPDTTQRKLFGAVDTKTKPSPLGLTLTTPVIPGPPGGQAGTPRTPSTPRTPGATDVEPPVEGELPEGTEISPDEGFTVAPRPGTTLAPPLTPTPAGLSTDDIILPPGTPMRLSPGDYKGMLSTGKFSVYRDAMRDGLPTANFMVKMTPEGDYGFFRVKGRDENELMKAIKSLRGKAQASAFKDIINKVKSELVDLESLKNKYDISIQEFTTKKSFSDLPGDKAALQRQLEDTQQDLREIQGKIQRKKQSLADSELQYAKQMEAAQQPVE